MTKKWKTSDLSKLRIMYNKGFSRTEIAKELGSTERTVSSYISNEVCFGRLKTRKQKEKERKKAIINNDFRIKPDRIKESFTYHIWKKRGMLSMSPEERVLMNELASINSAIKLITASSEDWWGLKDMKKFVKHISPKIKAVILQKEVEK